MSQLTFYLKVNCTNVMNTSQHSQISRKSKFSMWLIDVSQFYDEISDWRLKIMKTTKNFIQSFFFSNHCNNVDEVKKRCDQFLTKNHFICLQICLTIQINLTQCSTNRVDVHWTFVEIYKKLSSMFKKSSSKFNEFSSFNESSFMFNDIRRCSTIFNKSQCYSFDHVDVHWWVNIQWNE
jgi:transcription elongation factor Elf1